MTETPTDSMPSRAQADDEATTEATPHNGTSADTGTGTPDALQGDAGADDAGADDDVASPATSDGGARPASSSAQRLEEEGDVAADYLEELLDIVDLDGDIDIDVENGRASVSVVADSGSERSLRRLVGENGVVLEALQELTRLAVQTRTGERTRLMLDVAGHRAARRRELVTVAEKAIASVRSDGQSVNLEPMSPFERKVVHDAVADAGLRSESEGEDARRHVVVMPADA